MPKSKRARVVHLSRVEKKGKEHSEKLFNAAREAADEYAYAYVFRVENMRNNHLKDIRAELSDSRIFYGKSKLLAKALGTDAQSEHLPGLSQLTPHIQGEAGVLFSPRSPAEITPYLSAFARRDYARAGAVASRDIVVPAGVVHSRGGQVPVEDDVPVPHSVETTLRRWGMPTRLDKGKVVLDGDFVICRAGEPVDSHKAALAKNFGVDMVEFRVVLLAWWEAASGRVEEVQENVN